MGGWCQATSAALLGTLRRVLLVPQTALAALLGSGLAWLGVRLAAEALGGGEGFVDEVRLSSLLFVGALVLSLAEPLQVAGEARSGLLALRRARGGSFGLVARWAGLLLATLPALALTALAGGGWPAGGAWAVVDLGVLCAGGLLLGAFLERALLVPALWLLFVAGHLHPWLAGTPAGLVVPTFGAARDASGLAVAGLWVAGALLVARARLAAVAARAA